LVVLLCGVVLFASGYTAAIVLVPLLATELRAPVAQVGLLVAIPAILGAALGIPSAALSNRVGRRRLIRLGFVFLGVTAAGYLAAPSFLWIVPAQVSLGLAKVLFWPSALAAFSEIRSARGQESIQGANALAQGLASFMGATLAGLITAFASFEAAAILLVAFAALGLGTTVVLDESLPPGVRADRLQMGATLRSAVHLARFEPEVALAVTSLFWWSLLWWVAGASFFVLFISELGYSAAFAGLLLGVRIAVASLVRVNFGATSRRLSLPSILIWGNVIAAIGLGLTVLLPNPAVLIASSVIQGIGLALVLPASNVTIGRATRPAERAAGLALATSTTNLAVLLAAPAIGFLAASTGTAAALGAAAAVAGICSAIPILGFARAQVRN
jgi:MFS family permease